MPSLVDAVLGDAPATSLARTAVAAPPRPRQPIQWPPRPVPDAAPAQPTPLRDRVGSRLRGSRDNTHAGLRSRTRVVISLAVAGAAVVAAVATTRVLAATTATNFAGVFVAQAPVQLNFAATGTLASIDVTPGQTVQVGQILATETDVALAQAVRSDHLALASDDQHLAQLLGPAAAVDEKAAAAQYQKAQTAAAAQQARGAATVVQEQSILSSAQQAVAAAQAQETADEARKASACQGLGSSACASLTRTVQSDANVLAQDDERVSRAQAALAAAESTDVTLTQLANQELQLAQQAPQNVSTAVADDISATRDAIARDLAQLAADEQALQGGTLVSPVSGVVVAVYGQDGELVGPAGGHAGQGATTGSVPGGSSSPAPSSVNGLPSGTQPLVTIDAAPGLEAIAQVPEAQIPHITRGEPATVSADALGGRTFAAKVAVIEPQPINVQGAVYYDIALMPSGPPWTGDLLPGMTANISIPG